jgi:hypothetical protein
MSRLCSLDKHCRFLAQAGSVLSTNIAGLWFKPAMFFLTIPLLVCGSNRQCSLDQHCRFLTQVGCAVSAITTFFFAYRQWTLVRILIFYSLFYCFLCNQVLLYICYADFKSINIKYYKYMETIQMYLSRSRNYNSLASHSDPYYALYSLDFAMENVSFSIQSLG